MSKWVIIFMVGSAVWSMIQGAIQNAEKKKREERMREEALGKQQDSHIPSPSGPRREVPVASKGNFQPAAPGRAAGVQPGHDLADRRKAQLEQLRKRRQQRLQADPRKGTNPRKVIDPRKGAKLRAGGAATPVRPQPATLAPPSLSRPSRIAVSQVPGDQVLELPASRRALEVRRDIDTQRKKHPHSPAEVREQEQLSRTGTPRRKSGRKPKAAPVLVPQATKRRTASSSDKRVVDQVADPLQGSSIRREFENPAALRRAFILKELLDPPLALRRSETGPLSAG